MAGTKRDLIFWELAKALKSLPPRILFRDGRIRDRRVVGEVLRGVLLMSREDGLIAGPSGELWSIDQMWEKLGIDRDTIAAVLMLALAVGWHQKPGEGEGKGRNKPVTRRWLMPAPLAEDVTRSMRNAVEVEELRRRQVREETGANVRAHKPGKSPDAGEKSPDANGMSPDTRARARRGLSQVDDAVPSLPGGTCFQPVPPPDSAMQGASADATPGEVDENYVPPGKVSSKSGDSDGDQEVRLTPLGRSLGGAEGSPLRVLERACVALINEEGSPLSVARLADELVAEELEPAQAVVRRVVRRTGRMSRDKKTDLVRVSGAWRLEVMKREEAS